MKINEFNVDNSNEYRDKDLVLEASAGTGKTYSITKIVKNIVKTKNNKNGVDIKKILIVTYTEKATSELKDRIRKELYGVVDDEDLDNLNIYTIHSFCQNAIKEFGIEANAPLNLEVIDESMVSDFFDRYLRDNSIKDDVSWVILNDEKFNTNTLKEYFLQVVNKYYLKTDGSIDESIISLKKYDEIKGFQEDIKNIIKKISFNSMYNNYPGFKESYDNLSLIQYNIRMKLFLEAIKRGLDLNPFSMKLEINIANSEEYPLSKDEKDALESFYKYSEKGVIKGPDVETLEEAIKYFGLENSYNILVSSNVQTCNYFVEELRKSKSVKPKGGGIKHFDLKVCKIIKLSKLNPLQYADDYDKIYNIAKKLQEKNCNYIWLLCKYINDFYLKWQEEKTKNKQQEFSDMLRTIREKLLDDKNGLKKALQDKYTYAIIDEFQDTNQLQFDTFKKIFMKKDDHHIIVVGDPKQSIYAFQGADLNVYMKAKEEIVKVDDTGTATNMYELLTNYRSTKGIIDSCNKFFKVDDKTGERFFSNLDFADSKPPKNDKKKATFNGNDIKSFWVGVQSGDSTEPIQIKPEEYAKCVVKKIIECATIVDGKTRLQVWDKTKEEQDEEKEKLRNVTFKDFTILYRTRSEAANIVRELKHCGIPFIKYKDTTLFSSQECANFAAILEAISVPDFTGYNRKIIKRALFTDFFGRSLSEINTEYFEHNDCEEIKLIAKWSDIAKERKWEDLIDSIITDSKLLKILRSIDKMSSLALYKQLGDFCISYLYDNHSLEDLVLKLKQIDSSSEDDDKDAGTVEIGTDYDAVKLMTIYASKGLQFPVVVSVAGFKGKYPKTKAFIFHDKNDNNRRKISLESSDADDDLKEEWERLIYVGYTRAEYLMMIPYYVCSPKDSIYGPFLAKKTKHYLDKFKGDFELLDFDPNTYKTSDLISQVEKILQKTCDNSNKDDQTNNIKQIIRLDYVRKTHKHSYSSLSSTQTKNKKEEIFEEENKDKAGENDVKLSLKEFDGKAKQIFPVYTNDSHASYDGLPRGNVIGTAMHEVFERIDFTDCDSNLKTVIKERLEANRIHATDELSEYIENMVHNVLNASFPEIQGSNETGKYFKLNKINNDDKKSEIEFNFNVNDDRFRNYLNGFIDLLFKRGDYYSILDWKSNTLNDEEFTSYNNSECLKEHTDKEYSIQRVLYSYCLIKWLKQYYPEKKEQKIFEDHFGGVYYVYVRGCAKDSGNGIYCQTWNSYKELKDAYENIVKNKIRGVKK